MKEIPYLAEAVAQVIQEARNEARLSQVALAREAQCARSFISFIETRDHLPSLNGFLVLSRVLGIPSVELLRRLEDRLAMLEALHGDDAPPPLP